MPALVKAIEQRRFKQAKLLVQLGDDVNEKNKETGRSPLIESCLIEDAGKAYKVCVWLLSEGADAGITDGDGLNAFMHACKQGRTKLAEMFISDLDIDLNVQDLDGDTALSYAVQAGDAVITNSIISEMRRRRVRGSDKPNKHGETPLILAAKLGHKECMEILLRDGSASPHARDMQMRLTASEWETLKISRTRAALQKAKSNCKRELIVGRSPFPMHRKEDGKTEYLRKKDDHSNHEKDLCDFGTSRGDEMTLGSMSVTKAAMSTKRSQSEGDLAQGLDSPETRDTGKHKKGNSTTRQETRETPPTRTYLNLTSENEQLNNTQGNRKKSYSAKGALRSGVQAQGRIIKSANAVGKKPGQPSMGLLNTHDSDVYNSMRNSPSGNTILDIRASAPDLRSISTSEIRHQSLKPELKRVLSAPQRAYIRHVERFRREKREEAPMSSQILLNEFRSREKSFVQNQLPKLLHALGEQNMPNYRPKAKPPAPKVREVKSASKMSINENTKAGGRRFSKVGLAWIALRRFSGIYTKADFGSLAGKALENKELLSSSLPQQNSSKTRRQSISDRHSLSDSGQSFLIGRRKSVAVSRDISRVFKTDSSSSLESLRNKLRQKSSGSDSSSLESTKGVATLTKRSTSGVSENTALSVESDLPTVVGSRASITVFP